MGGVLLFLALLLSALAPSLAIADGGQISLGETRATSYPRVSAKMSITDSEGVPVGNLEATDFEVRENGQLVRDVHVQTIQKSPTPLSIVLAVDVSGSMRDQGRLDRAKEAATTFINGLRGIDKVELMSFSTTVNTVVRVTNDRKALSAGLQQLTPAGDTALYDALYGAVGAASKMTGNRVVMLLTDGEDTASKGTLQQASDLALEVGVPVYSIGLGQEVKDDILRAIAEGTAGMYLKAPNADDLAYTFKRLSQQIQNLYELVYMSPLPDGARGNVDVTVATKVDSQPVTARFSYIIPEVLERERGTVETGELRRVPEPKAATPRIPLWLPPYLAEFASFLAFAGVLALLFGLVTVRRRSQRDRRLETFVGAPQRRASSRTPTRSRLIEWFNRMAYRAFLKLLPRTWMEDTRNLLMMAGYPQGQGVERFMGLRAVLTLGLAAFGFVIALPVATPQLAMLLAFGLGGVGFVLPIFLLKARIKNRQYQILRAMPNAMDLLSVSVEAGLGFDQALVEVCTKWQNPLTQELTIVLNEMRLGSSRRDALRALGRRTGVQELSTFASAVIQADELGASIVRTLENQAAEIRIRRRQLAQELAHQAPVKMAFPLVFLMLPALFVVILGPAVPSLLHSLGSVVK